MELSTMSVSDLMAIRAVLSEKIKLCTTEKELYELSDKIEKTNLAIDKIINNL